MKKIVFIVIIMSLIFSGCNFVTEKFKNNKRETESSTNNNDKDDNNSGNADITETGNSIEETREIIRNKGTDIFDDYYTKLPISMVNESGVDIYELYASPASANDWGYDILGDDILYDEYVYNDQFSISPSTLEWDFQIVDSEDNVIYFYDVDFSDYSVNGVQLTLTYDGYDAYIDISNLTSIESNIEYDIPIGIINNTGFEIYYLYSSPASDEYWGDDILNSTISYGDYDILYFPISQDTLDWDIRVEDIDGNYLEYYVDFSDYTINGGILTLNADETATITDIN
jgi:hypothetical protein